MTGKVTCLERTAHSIFYEKPQYVFIHFDQDAYDISSQKLNELIKRITDNGPLVAKAKMGPDHYIEDPVKQSNQLHGCDIYQWRKGALRKKNSEDNYIIILGATDTILGKLVYYTLSIDVTVQDQPKELQREHRPSGSDTNIYSAPFNVFMCYLFRLYRPKLPIERPEVPLKSKEISILTFSEQKYVDKLVSIQPFEAIIDNGKTESFCKAIGQEIFDRFKTEAKGDSEAGRRALVKICNSIYYYPTTGPMRKLYIELAWTGIGDENWTWVALLNGK